MTPHALFAAASLCVLTAAQPARADSITCFYTAARDASGINIGTNGGAIAFEIDGIAIDLEHGGHTQPQTEAREAKVRFNSLSITKHVDKASPTLFLMAAAGTPFTSVSCSFYAEAQVAGVAPSPYLTAVVTDAKISKFETQKAADGTPQTSITFVYDQLQWKF